MLTRYKDSLFEAIQDVHMYTTGSLECSFSKIKEIYDYLVKRYVEWHELPHEIFDIMVKELLRHTIRTFEIQHKKDLERMMAKALFVKE